MGRRQTASSNTYRFFVPPGAVDGESVRVEDPDLARQLTAVLRLGAGDRVVLLDGGGDELLVELTEVGRGRVAGRVERRSPAAGEPRLALALYVGLMRAERFEWVLQKGTELGASALVPVLCERSASEGGGAARHTRWARIIREAAEQSRRGRLPELRAPLPFTEACAAAAAAGPALLLWEGEGAAPLREALRGASAGGTPAALALISGPEGGLSDAELRRAEAAGVAPVTLGPRTLRAETAPVAAAAAALYEYGEMS